MTTPLLSDLIDNTKTDIARDHCYLETYQRLFDSLSIPVKNIVEIGLSQPGSVKLWRDYFTTATVYGIDALESKDLNVAYISSDERIVLCTGKDAYGSDLSFLPEDTTYDIIIDDGPHVLELLVKMLKNFVPLLNKGGVLVIEDVQSIDWIPTLTAAVPSSLQSSIEVVDLRSINNKADDILFILKL